MLGSPPPIQTLNLTVAQQEILSWTFTPHTAVTDSEPLKPAGQQTTFSFGDHTYAVTYPAGGPPTDGIDMVVTANPVSPGTFTSLMFGTPFAGSDCQVYGSTGGNCIIYSVHCVNHISRNKVACPSTLDPTIAVKTAYQSDNSAPPPAFPGFLHGEPLYSPISTIERSGTTATVTCTGACSVADGDIVSIRESTALNAEDVVASVPDASILDSFTYQVSASGSTSGIGGFVTSRKLENICNPLTPDPEHPDVPPCFRPERIDGTTTGRTKNFSDLAALSTTIVSVPNMTISKTHSGNFTQGQTGATYSIRASNVGSGPSSGTVTVTDTLPAGLSATQLSGSGWSCSLTSLSCQRSTVLAAGSSYPAITLKVNVASNAPSSVTNSATVSGGGDSTPGNNTATSPTTINPAAAAQINISPSSIPFGTVYLDHNVIRNVTIKNTGTTTLKITGISLTPGSGPGAHDFEQSGSCGTLTPGQSCTIKIIFDVNHVGAANATLNIQDNAPGSPQHVSMSGNAIDPKANPSPRSLSFGSHTVNSNTTKTVKLTNNGTTTLTLGASPFSFTGSNTADFSQTNNCSSSLAAGANCTITVKFTPKAKGSRSASMKITDNAFDNPQTVTLTGNGT